MILAFSDFVKACLEMEVVVLSFVGAISLESHKSGPWVWKAPQLQTRGQGQVLCSQLVLALPVHFSTFPHLLGKPWLVIPLSAIVHCEPPGLCLHFQHGLGVV